MDADDDMDAASIWKKLNSISVMFELRGSHGLVMASSKCIVDLVRQHNWKVTEIEDELRKRNLYIWIYADVPSTTAMLNNVRVPLKCMNMKKRDELSLYALSVSVGDAKYFHEKLTELGMKYDENYNRLNECGVYVVQSTEE